jgi:hypothetical protein
MSMKERPILFRGAMVRAILDGRKTQTRRVMKPQADCNSTHLGHVGYGPCVVLGMRAGMFSIPCPYGQPGDRLWVRETFVWRAGGAALLFRADFDYVEAAGIAGMYGGWKPSIFMPGWASRITLEIVSVRVERLQEITEEDAKAEGVEVKPSAGIASIVAGGNPTPAQFEYYALWESINAKTHPWASNPWVWVIEFKKV